MFEPSAAFQYAPIRPLRISLVRVDREMLLEWVAWKHGRASLAARVRVRGVAVALSHPVVVLHPTESEARRVKRLLHTAMDVQAQEEAGEGDGFAELLTIASQLMEIVDPLMVRGHPHGQLAAHLRAAAEVDFPTVRHPAVRRAMEFLASTPPHRWSLAALAERACLSPGYFARVFAADVGCSPRQFLSERRLTEFIVLVHSSTLTVNQAARRVGWASTSHAIAAYRRHTGTTPAKARA